MVAKSEEKKAVVQLPERNWWSGLMLQVDAASLLQSTLLKTDRYSVEGSAQLGFRKKLYPVFEIGFAGAEKEMKSLATFKTNAPFSRIGLDVNLLTPKPDAKPSNNLFLIGARLGYTNFSYSVNNLIITDPYWKQSEIRNYPDQSANKLWYELVAGVKVEVYKNLYLGWSIRSRNLLSKETSGAVSPWYIPGYGLNGSANWGFNYTIGYLF